VRQKPGRQKIMMMRNEGMGKGSSGGWTDGQIDRGGSSSGDTTHGGRMALFRTRELRDTRRRMMTQKTK
jgi:hypothetical protein